MPDPKTGALPLGYAPMRILKETNRKRPKVQQTSVCWFGKRKLAVHFLAILIPRYSRYGKLSPGDLSIKGFQCCLPCLLFVKYSEHARSATAHQGLRRFQLKQSFLYPTNLRKSRKNRPLKIVYQYRM